MTEETAGTPRTDYFLEKNTGVSVSGGRGFVNPDSVINFARQLEREVAALTAQLAELHKEWEQDLKDGMVHEAVPRDKPCESPPWVAVTERLPKVFEQVWAWDNGRGSNPAVLLPQGGWAITYDDTEIKPTHWMPLPPPPATGMFRGSSGP
jgi:hypothetical protein